MEFIVPIAFYRCALHHNPTVWLCACVFLCLGTYVCACTSPGISSVVFYLCQTPFLWSFYAMFFMFGMYSDALCVLAGLCVAGCFNVIHFFSLAPAAAWCIMPYVGVLFGHFVWTIRLLRGHDEDAVLRGSLHCVCHSGHGHDVHECECPGP